VNVKSKIDRYAKILFSISDTSEKYESIEKILYILSTLCNTSLIFKQFLLTKRISSDLKKEILLSIFKDLINESEIDLIIYLMEGIDLRYIKLITEKYKKLISDSRGNVKVEVVTAEQLSNLDLTDIEEKINSKINGSVIISNTIDKNILGGIKLKVGNTLIDGSIKTKLDKLKQSMITNK
jgi:F-type H+-transporting ATPase subunit delta